MKKYIDNGNKRYAAS